MKYDVFGVNDILLIYEQRNEKAPQDRVLIYLPIFCKDGTDFRISIKRLR
jgi:hypothetical protein